MPPISIQPAEMIFVDDVEESIVAARALGIHGIVFKDNAQTIAELEAILQATLS